MFDSVRFGAGWGTRRTEALERLLRSSYVLAPDDRTATTFARLKVACERSAHPLHQKIHTGDLWIAATAVRRGLVLVSDDAAFDDCPELQVIRQPA